MDKEEFKSLIIEALDKIVAPYLKAINMHLDSIERELADKPIRDEVQQMLANMWRIGVN